MRYRRGEIKFGAVLLGVIEEPLLHFESHYNWSVEGVIQWTPGYGQGPLPNPLTVTFETGQWGEVKIFPNPFGTQIQGVGKINGKSEWS